MSISGAISGQASVTAILRGSGLAPVPIHWTAASDAVDGYNIYRGTAPGLENFKVNVVLITGTTFVDYNAPPGLNYYIVKSSIQGVESQVSNEVAIGLISSSAAGHCVVGGFIHSGTSAQIFASIAGKASVSGTGKRAGKLAGAISGHATVSGATTNSGFIVSSITGHASTSALLKGSGKLAGSVAGHASVAGQLKGSTSLASAVAGHATVMVHTTQFSNITGHASVGGGLKGLTHLSDSISPHPTVAGTLKGSASALSGSISGHATVSGVIKGKTAFVSSIAGHASVAGTVKGVTSLASSITGHASVQLVENLLANVAGHATVAGTLKGNAALVSSIAGHASVSGTILGAGSIAGAPHGHATVGGTTSILKLIASNIVGVSSVSGTPSGTGNVLTFITLHPNVSLFVSPGPITASIAGQANVSGSPFFGGVLRASVSGFTNVSIRNTPFVPTLISIGSSIGRGFAVSSQNPALIITNQNDLELFSSSLPVAPVASADGWASLGQRVMQGQLLVAPGNGCLPGRSYAVVAAGDVTIPSASSSTSVNLVLNENYFSIVNQTITTTSVPMATLPAPFALPPGTYAWSIVCRLADNGSNNGFVQSLYSVTIEGVTFNGRASSNVNPFVQPKLQFSLGVQFGGSSGPHLFQARLIQFELQQV